MKTKKNVRILSVAIAIIMLITIAPLKSTEAQAAASYTTKAQVEKRIKTLNSEVSKLDKTYKEQKRKRDQQKKGAIYIYGSVENYNPFIVSSYYSNSFYWVLNPSKLDCSLLLGAGYVKKTGRYRTKWGIKCAEVKAIYVSNAANKTKKKLDAKKAELKKLKKSLTDSPEISLARTEIIEGDSDEIYAGMKRSTGKYNKLTWTSSNPEVCTVKNGAITAVSPGTATIKVKASVSGKTASTTIKVVEFEDKYKLKYDSYNLAANEYYNINLEYDTDNLLGEELGFFSSKNVKWESSDTSVATVYYNTYYTHKAEIKAVASGTFDIICTINGKYVLKQTFTVKGTGTNSGNTNSGSSNNSIEGHSISLEKSYLYLETDDAADILISTGEDLQSIGYEVTDEYGREVDVDELEVVLDEWDYNDITMHVYSGYESGSYIIKVYETDNTANYKNIFVTVG